MGDRCHMALYIHGHIGSLRTLVEVCKVIAIEGLIDEVSGDHREAWHAVFTHFAENIDDPHVMFVNQECNYADIEAVEKVLQKRGIAYSFDHGSGGNYTSGCGAYTPERGRHVCDTDGSYPVLNAPYIREALSKGTFEELLLNAEFAGGDGLPNFSVSDKVRVTLAKVIAQRALHRKAA